eukprot:1758999-Prymnesium_polylepis.2
MMNRGLGAGRGGIQPNGRRLDGGISPAVAIDAPARVHCVQKAAHLGRVPKSDARDEEVGKIDIICRERSDAGLQLGRRHVIMQPGVECLDSLSMRLAREQAERIVC